MSYCLLSFTHPHFSLNSSNFIAGRPKAALLVWFLGDFRSEVLLFIVMLVIKLVRIDVKYQTSQ